MSISWHCKNRMSQRSIKAWEVKRAIVNGFKIEQDNGTVKCEYRKVTAIYDESKDLAVSTWRNL